MIILGDIASPTKEHSDSLNQTLSGTEFKGKSLIVNLEGMVNDDHPLTDDKPILFNHSSVIKVLSDHNCKLVGLANNHSLDLPNAYTTTISHLNQEGIKYAGAGSSFENAGSPVILQNDFRKVHIINACWDFLLYNQTNPTEGLYINTISEFGILNKVKSINNDNPNDAIIIYLHWSFDLEILPFPMYRNWARDLIDAGAELVVGTHSHCVQGGEKYKDGYIVYGLGNFFLPFKTYANGKLTFPDFARFQLALEYNLQSKKAFCHWYQCNEENEVKWDSTEAFEQSKTLKKFSPFQNMHDDEYLTYFKKHRRKRKLIPIYKDYRNVNQNKRYTYFLDKRAKLARFLAEKQIISWQN